MPQPKPTPTLSAAPPRAPAPAHDAAPIAAIASLAFAAFVIVTTEFLMVGLLPALAKDLGITIAVAGQLVTLFAVTVMLSGPFLTAGLGHLERKRLFMAILLLFAGANALAAVAPNWPVLAIARVIPAMALPVFWGTASETAAELAGPGHAGRAISTVYLGISAAMLLGIPLGTLEAEALGWRRALGTLALLSLAAAGLLARYMPTVHRPQRLKLGQQAQILRDRHFLAHVGLSVLIYTAMFTAYTYLAETLQRIGGIAPAQVGWWLMGFGTVGLMGNWLGGRWTSSHPLATTAACCGVLALGMVMSVGLAPSPVGLALALTLWGVANTALYPSCQIRVMQAASHAQALAGTMNVSAANAGIALGAMLGGWCISNWGLISIGPVAAAIALLVVALCPLVARQRRRSG